MAHCFGYSNTRLSSRFASFLAKQDTGLLLTLCHDCRKVCLCNLERVCDLNLHEPNIFYTYPDRYSNHALKVPYNA